MFWYYQRRRDYGRRANTAYFDAWVAMCITKSRLNVLPQVKSFIAEVQENADRRYNERVRKGST